MSSFDFSQSADGVTGLWHFLPHGSHKEITNALMADKAVAGAVDAFTASRGNVTPVVDLVARATGNLVGLVVRNLFLKDVPLDPANQATSCWKILPGGTEHDVVDAIIHDKTFTDLLPTITGTYLVNRISRMTGLAIGQAVGKDAHEVIVLLGKVIKAA